MTAIKTAAKIHLTEAEIAHFLSGADGSAAQRAAVERHLAGCDECLETAVSAYESVELYNNTRGGKRKDHSMKKINIYLVFAIMTFALSFLVPRYFAQFLVATLLLGVKWVADSKTTKMLVMIYEAWKDGREKDISRIFGPLEETRKTRARF
jgi:hypothetical protein